MRNHNVAVFSSNYTLYASFSARFATVVESLAPQTFVYSIDELFADASHMEGVMTPQAFGQLLRAEVLRQTTLTCGVGVAPTKTLALYSDQYFLSGSHDGSLSPYATSLSPQTGEILMSESGNSLMLASRYSYRPTRP
uniref:Y-family DNA polymerase n=1 Tax=Yersinia frederiksenii TaxID=29484 RepID=UPI0022CF1A97|nr:hypothetical protein [Yersinia frederiksenii]ULG19792.1 ImpB/MucB/SamB family protein [Yersinia frederiksenii]